MPPLSGSFEEVTKKLVSADMREDNRDELSLKRSRKVIIPSLLKSEVKKNTPHKGTKGSGK